ncbi:hypothetical protein TanjilG_25085 [Lupinus angustifolius]|uniref:Uncharacterized protein n=1 Tax=Lupinus angustifolius TaxID=3871 RepID=A0A394DD29_LUPAN|nr:hypothetical protein TanjilG_25081 [Lupinus angustifolius]OIW20913.1 hypothetical protein TanjilG_25085 [Lupinus angustifolius]
MGESRENEASAVKWFKVRVAVVHRRGSGSEGSVTPILSHKMGCQSLNPTPSSPLFISSGHDEMRWFKVTLGGDRGSWP